MPFGITEIVNVVFLSCLLILDLPYHPQEFKQFFAVLRLSSLDLHSRPKESKWSGEGPEWKILLENCIIIQTMKKKPVKHGFTLLLVPEGLYTMSAPSESDKNNWVKTIRETISKQAKLGKQTMAPVNSQEKQSENFDIALPSRPISRTVRALDSRISEYTGPEMRTRKLMSSRSLGRENGRSRMSLQSTKSLEKLRRDKPLLVSRNSRTHSGPSYLTEKSLAPEVKHIIPTEVHCQEQSNLNRCKDGSLDTLSISSTVDMKSRKYSDASDVTITGDGCGTKRKFLTMPRRNSPAQCRRGTLVAVEEFQNHRQDDRSSTPLSITERTKSRNRFGEGDSSNERARKNYLNSECFRGGSSANSDRYMGNDIYSGRSPIISTVKSPEQTGVHSQPVRSVEIQRSSPVRYLTNGTEEPPSSTNSPKTITILRQVTPVNGHHESSNSTLVANLRDPHEIAEMNGQNFRNDIGDDERSKDKHELNKVKTDLSTFQLGIFNFRQSSDREKYGARGSRIVTIPAGTKKHLLESKEIESALLLENQQLRERIQLLHQQNNELESNISGLREMVENGVDPGLNSLKANYSPRDRYPYLVSTLTTTDTKRAVSVPPQRVQVMTTGNIPAYERVEAWLMENPSKVANGFGVERSRRKMNNTRRRTTNDIPSAEYIQSSATTKDDNISFGVNRTFNLDINSYGTFALNAHTQPPQDTTHTTNFADRCPSPVKSIEDIRSAASPTLLTNKVSTFAVSDTADPKYSSTMWCRLVELWSTLLNEERKFWKLQLENVMLQQRQPKNSSLSLWFTELLEKVNQMHSAETVMLWKHVYENWVPHDYLEYLSDEIRKALTCLHTVIDTLFGIVECTRQPKLNDWGHLDKALMDLRQEVLKLRHSPHQSALHYDPRNNVAGTKSNSLLENEFSSLSAQRRPSEVSVGGWHQTRTHSQLLEQIYGVAEMVGAALDTDMGDSIQVARHNTTGDKINPLRSIPGSGLQVAAKLQSLVLDLEARLAVTCLADGDGSNVQNPTALDSNFGKSIEHDEVDIPPSVPLKHNGSKLHPNFWSLDEPTGFNLEP
ncbi:PH domain protein [Opisthorchis viverrini]|uniref:PH domain protein n=1 Tax=Opisthorchis viverrini TaxID=6198 RepID=A0A1S8X8W8_OPIVI|nr:PH domain protein [Opisthorchis viverrini]